METKLTYRRCPECGEADLVKDPIQGELVCKSCGFVIKESLQDERPEWRAFTAEEDRSRKRVGPPTSFSSFDKGLTTDMAGYRDAFGRRIPSEMMRELYRLRKRHTRSKVDASKDRNLSIAMTELDKMSDKLFLPKHVKEEAAVIYRRALDKDLIRGRSIKSMVAASIYAACRLYNVVRSLKDVTKSSGKSRKEVSRCYRLILKNLDLKMPIDDPTRYVSRIASRTGVSTEIEKKAIEILREAQKKKVVTGKDPKGMAAAAIYIASRQKDKSVTQRELAESANVTEVTVRSRYKTLKNQLYPREN